MDKKIISVIQYYPDYLDILKEYETLQKQNTIFSSGIMLVLSIEKIIERNSSEMARHSKAIINLIDVVATDLNLTKKDTDKLKLLARFHDIGKICVAASILTKEDTLTKEEWDIVKKHSYESYLILNNVDELKSIAYEALCHHENYDGSGYPNGLRGQEIPLFSRIIRVLDAYEVLTSGRVYQKAVSVSDALIELNACKNKQFDPQIVDCVTRVFSEENNL
jgi:HD-GYP domain-containing protein (c-di-GMP phosphodiesterase class II)